MQEAAGFLAYAAAAAAAAVAAVQELGPVVGPMPGPVVEPVPELAVEPEPGPVVEPEGPAKLAVIVLGHLVGHSLVEPGLPLQVVSLPLQAAWLMLQLQVLSLVAS